MSLDTNFVKSNLLLDAVGDVYLLKVTQIGKSGVL